MRNNTRVKFNWSKNTRIKFQRIKIALAVWAHICKNLLVLIYSQSCDYLDQFPSNKISANMENIQSLNSQKHMFYFNK